MTSSHLPTCVWQRSLGGMLRRVTLGLLPRGLSLRGPILRGLLVVGAAPSCTLYDAALLDEARGGAHVGDGDDAPMVGGTGAGATGGSDDGEENPGIGGDP